MPRSHGRVESESKQMWSKYYATHQLREMSAISTMSRQRRGCQPECQGRAEVRKQSLSRGEPIIGSSSPIKNPASTADPSPVRPALLYPSTRNSRMYRMEDESR